MKEQVFLNDGKPLPVDKLEESLSEYEANAAFNNTLSKKREKVYNAINSERDYQIVKLEGDIMVDGSDPLKIVPLSKTLSKEEKDLAFDKADPIIAMHKSELVRMITNFINYHADDYSQVTIKQIDRRLDEYFKNKT